MEGEIVVVPIGGVCAEVLDGLGGFVGEQLEVDIALGGVDDGGVAQPIALLVALGGDSDLFAGRLLVEDIAVCLLILAAAVLVGRGGITCSGHAA